MASAPIEVRVTPLEVYQAWQDWRAGKKLGFSPRLSEDASWTGASHNQIDGWVRDGYNDGEPLQLPDDQAEMLVPAIEFDEDEGDLVYSLAIAGDDMPRARWENLPAPRGVSIIARLSLNGGVSSDQLNAFAKWLLAVVDGIERMGESPELSISFDTIATDGTLLDVIIPVRRPGEVVDVDSWRALFAPGGYRSLIFLSSNVGAHKLGKTVQSGYPWWPSTPQQDWTVDMKDGVMRIYTPTSMSRFDEDAMTKQVMEALA